MKLLLVDNDSKLVKTLSHLLKKNGFTVDFALDGEKGLEMICSGSYDIIILNHNLPYLDGISLLQELRSLRYHTPILMLTTKDTPEGRAEVLNAGADDCLIKPFFAVELLARLYALARRRNTEVVDMILRVDDMIFDPRRAQVIKNGKTINLTFKESQLLELLIRNSGQVLTKQQILDKVWGFDSDVIENTINIYIHYLRKKINISRLKTVRGIGYCWQKGS